MQIREENGWSVPHFEQLLSGSCRPSFHVNYRDWDHIKTTIFNMDDKERHTFIDAGANIGLVSVPAKQYFKRVYAIEPHPITAECLEKNMSNEQFGMPSGKYKVIQAVAGRNKGTSELYCPPNPNTSGYMTTRHQENWSVQTVPQMCIDGLGLPHCDFLKLDVQGSELDVVLGAEQTIKMYKPFVYIETKEGLEAFDLLLSWGYRKLHSFRKGHEVLNHKHRRLK